MPDVWDAIQYIAVMGGHWRLLPTAFPPVSTVQYHFYRLRDGTRLAPINEALVMPGRGVYGGDIDPTAGVIDSQSKKTTNGRRCLRL